LSLGILDSPGSYPTSSTLFSWIVYAIIVNTTVFILKLFTHIPLIL
jgi:hypothetical protein